MVWKRISVEIQTIRNLFGVTLQRKTRNGSSVIQSSQIIWKVFGVTLVMNTEESRLRPEMAMYVKHGTFSNHSFIHLQLQNIPMMVLRKIIVGIQELQLKAFGVLLLTFGRDGTIVTLFMQKSWPQVRNLSQVRTKTQGIEVLKPRPRVAKNAKNGPALISTLRKTLKAV